MSLIITGEQPQGGGPQGVSIHNQLKERDAPDTHPISSITGLEEILEKLSDGKKRVYLIDIPEGTVLPAGTVIRCDNIDVVQPNGDYYSELAFIVERVGGSDNGFVFKITGENSTTYNSVMMNGNNHDVFEAGFDAFEPPNYGKYRENNGWLINNPSENFWIKLLFDSELSKEYLDTTGTETFLPTLYVELAEEKWATIEQVNNAITTHNTDENAHEYLKQYIDSKHPVVVSNMSISNAIFNSSNPLVPNTFYEFGFLTSLQINQIPKSFLPVVIWFKCISKTTLILPLDILFEGDMPDKTGDYELSIMNGLAFCKWWNYPYEE